MLKKSIVALLFIAWCITALMAQNHQFVDPMIGSEGLGRVFIGPSCPFGMVKPGPDVTSRPNSGWKPMPAPLEGFSQVHVSGTGGGPKYGNISIMPFSGDLEEIQQTALRQNETVKLGYYATTFKESGIKTEITSADRASFYKVTYPKDTQKAMKVDLGFYLGATSDPEGREAQQFVGSEIEIVSETEVRGYSRIRGGWNNGPAYTVYFYAIFDQPISSFATWKDGQLQAGQAEQFDSNQQTGALLAFGNEKGNELNVKIGISFLSALKAKNNIQQEIPHWDFEKVRQALQTKWENLLSRIQIAEDTPEAKKKMFYTGLYHTMLMPVNRTGENPLWTESPYYDDFYCIWDTYRSSNPLITLIDPKREVEIINAMLNIYKREGYLPEGRSGNANGRTQGGSHAEVLIADAYVKGLEGIDYEYALKAMRKDAEVPPGGNEEAEGRGGLTEYLQLGYVPHGIDRAGNRTMDYAFNDYNIALVAKGLGKSDIYEEYLHRSDNWQNLWRTDYEHSGTTGFIMPKDADGNWLDRVLFGESKIQKPTYPYTPITREAPWYECHWCVFFYEGTSWEYSLSVPHDIPAVIEKSGGNTAFQKRLDTFFDKGFYNVANEPSFLAPTLYHWIGRPDLSSARIRNIITQNYNASPTGLPGNDDSGAMSSWLAFHMMGLYPNAGLPYYLINAPLLRQTTINLEDGKTFEIQTKNFSSTNKYVVAARLNGQAYNQAWITHEDIIKGGVLELQLGSESADWGSEILPPVIK